MRCAGEGSAAVRGLPVFTRPPAHVSVGGFPPPWILCRHCLPQSRMGSWYPVRAAFPAILGQWVSSDFSVCPSGILTKPDLVDRGTEEKVVDVVRNLVCHLKKGYMIVKCRGQQDILEHLSLSEALQKEHTFFKEHPHFRCLHHNAPCSENCWTGADLT